MQVRLGKEQVWKWHEDSNLYVKGFAFLPDGQFLENDELKKWIYSKVFNTELNLNSLNALFKNLNGFFSVVIQIEGKTFAVVDKVRSFPLFYRIKGGETIVTDNPVALLGGTPIEIQPHIRHQFLHSGFVAGTATLMDNIEQVMAGCIAGIDEASGTVQQHPYFEHLHGDYFDDPKNALINKLEETSSAVFQRLVQSAKGQPIVVPLSGGYDSRFIAAMLKKLEYKHVICYTYGRANSFEVKRARKVAAGLGFPWFFVAYDKPAFQPLFANTGKAYLDYATDAASLPHEQDFFALHKLQQSKEFPKNAIIVPGFCGDVLAGSFIPNARQLKAITFTTNGLTDFILKTYFQLDQGDASYEPLRKLVLAELSTFSISSHEQFLSVYEHWVTVNRLAKYTVNANRITEFFGHEWRMPLWDDAWIHLWYRIPYSLRTDQALYREFLDDRIFAPLGIRISGKIFDEHQRHDGLIPFIKAQLPGKARKLLKPLFVPSNVADPNNFRMLAKIISGHLRTPLKPGEPKDVNYVHAKWHLEGLEKGIKDHW